MVVTPIPAAIPCIKRTEDDLGSSETAENSDEPTDPDATLWLGSLLRLAETNQLT